MDNPIVKILRFLLFFPICFTVIAIVNWGFGYLLFWSLELSRFWFIVVVIFLGGTIWNIFKWIAYMLGMLASYLSPIRWLGPITILILALINGGILCYKLWTLKDDFSGMEMFVAVIATILVVQLTFALIFGATDAE